MPCTHPTIRAELRFRAAMSGKAVHRTLAQLYQEALDLGDTVQSLKVRNGIWARSETLWHGSPQRPKPTDDPTGGQTPGGVVTLPEYKEIKAA